MTGPSRRGLFRLCAGVAAIKLFPWSKALAETPSPVMIGSINVKFAAGHWQDMIGRLYFVARLPGETRVEFEERRQLSIGTSTT